MPKKGRGNRGGGGGQGDDYNRGGGRGGGQGRGNNFNEGGRGGGNNRGGGGNRGGGNQGGGGNNQSQNWNRGGGGRGRGEQQDRGRGRGGFGRGQQQDLGVVQRPGEESGFRATTPPRPPTTSHFDAPSTSFGNVSTQRQQHQPATQPTSSAWVRNTETRAPPIHEPSAPAVAMPEDSDNQFQRGRGRGRGGRGRGRGDGGPGSQQSGGQGSVGRGFHGPRDDYDGGQVLGGPSGGAVGGQESIQAQQPVRPKTSQRSELPPSAASAAQMLQDLTVEDLEGNFRSSLHIGSGNGMKPIRRPDQGGIFGRKVTLLTNHFVLRMPSNLPDCYHYDIEIEPKMSADKKRDIFNKVLCQVLKLEHVKNKFVFDGQKNIYTLHKIPTEQLPPKKTEFEFVNDETGKTFKTKVTIQFAAEVDLSLIQSYIEKQTIELEKPQQALNVLNTAYKQLCLGMADFVTLKRATFAKPTGWPIDLTGGLDLWFGYQPSIIMGQWKVYLQVDITSKGFTRDTPMLKYASDYFECRNERDLGQLRLNQHDLKEFSKSVSGYKVKTTHKNFTKKINDIVRETASTKIIKDRGISVKQYFQQEYNISLKYPDLPLVRVNPKDKDICFPMEVCLLRGEQAALKKLSEKQQSIMVTQTAMDPSRRNQMIMEMLNKRTNPNSKPVFKAFGLNVNDRMSEIEGRVLPGPQMFGSGGRSVQAQEGKYRSQGFAEPSDELQNYVVLCPQRLQDKIGPMQNSFSQEARKAGMQWPQNGPLQVLSINDCDPTTVLRAINEVVNARRQVNNFNLVIIILFNKNSEIYAMAKHKLDNESQLASQVVLQRTISGRGPGQPPNPMSINQLLLKINTKLSGINVRTFQNYMDIISQTGNYGETFVQVAKQYQDIFREPFMVFGADVTHPEPGEHGKPSIAAVIGSLNSTLTRYGAQIRVQKSRQETIDAMKEMFMNLLREFKEKNRGRTPQKILYYRDGVSEGQFSEVLVLELQAMQAACKALNPNFTPAITFIVVNKRHKARFFNWGPSRNQPQGGIINIVPGTVVDVDIVHPFQFDFYLCSHEGIKGTSRPAHYHVLYDDSNFKSDTLQSFTYALCHLYARCTRAVSYPPPTYYAHHAAMRARHHVAYLMSGYPGSESGQSSNSGESDGADPRLIAFLNQNLIPASDSLLKRYPMYFI